MISGFNTDIIYEGVTYHIQTEDKGLETPLILSLIYDKGTILASKRSPYNDLLEGEFDENVLAERLQRQHKLICAAVKAGRIEDLKRMTLKDSASANPSENEPIQPPVEVELPQAETFENESTGFETFVIPREMLVDLPYFKEETDSFLLNEEPVSDENEFKTVIETKSVQSVNSITMPEIPVEPYALKVLREKTVFVDKSEEIFSQVADPFVRETGKIPKPDDGLIFEVPEIINEPIIEAVSVIEEEMILPDEAVMIVSESIKQPPVPDNKLKITLLNDMNFRGGERKTLNITVHRGDEDFGLVKAHVIIKILGSSFRPVIFHAKTDSNGIAVVHLQLPSFKAGRAVLLIRALYEGEECEMRTVIQQG